MLHIQKFRTTNLSRNTSQILLFSSAIFWSMGGLFIKLVHLAPMATAGFRSLVAFFVLLLLRQSKQFKFSRFMVLGCFAYAGTVILFVYATKLTTAANAILLQYSAPFYVAMFSSWFLGEKTYKNDWIIIAIVFSGLILFFIDSMDANGMIGNICAIGSGFCYAWLILFLRKCKDVSSLDIVVFGNAVTAIVCAPWFFSDVPDTRSIIAILILGIFQLGLPYFFYTIAIRNVRAVEAALIPIIEPILNPLWVMLFLGERPGIWACLGGVVVVSALVFRSVFVGMDTKKGLVVAPNNVE